MYFLFTSLYHPDRNNAYRQGSLEITQLKNSFQRWRKIFIIKWKSAFLKSVSSAPRPYVSKQDHEKNETIELPVSSNTALHIDSPKDHSYRNSANSENDGLRRRNVNKLKKESAKVTAKMKDDDAGKTVDDDVITISWVPFTTSLVLAALAMFFKETGKYWITINKAFHILQ